MPKQRAFASSPVPVFRNCTKRPSLQRSNLAYVKSDILYVFTVLDMRLDRCSQNNICIYNKPPLKRGNHFLMRETQRGIADVPLLIGVLFICVYTTHA